VRLGLNQRVLSYSMIKASIIASHFGVYAAQQMNTGLLPFLLPNYTVRDRTGWYDGRVTSAF